MLTPIANTMESSGFSVLGTFFGDTYKKEDGIEREDKTSNTEGFIYNSCNGVPSRACSLSTLKA